MTIVSSIGGPVPRFFFDTHDGNRSIADKVGLELESLEAAKAVAQAALAELVRDALPADDRRTFIVSVMDEAGQVVVRTTLSLVSEYPTEAPE
ncbi:DUF6894 family protein [Microvirga splendida]|uniref:DUF6894 family protein n=1 Tax=Microvirga splendida TaxID=2795727 RepID=UPI001AED547B|nr:hypothetical protein [Microvirga splendida]